MASVADPGDSGLNWSQELRLMFTRRAAGLPPEPWETPTWMVLDGTRAAGPISDFILNEYAAWLRDQDETERAARR